jgi:hypothetical protein
MNYGSRDYRRQSRSSSKYLSIKLDQGQEGIGNIAQDQALNLILDQGLEITRKSQGDPDLRI